MQPYDLTKESLVDAVLPHVPFDGWSDASFAAAVVDTRIDPELARIVCPRGGLDLAIAFHKRGDAAMMARLRARDLSPLKIRERITLAVRTRLEVMTDKDLVRRATTLFALPHHAGDGARLIWGTSDAIWNALNDPSRDINWYSKRATLSAVYSACVLFWLGDDSPGNQATWDFLDRRIEDVMRIETAKAALRKNPVLSRLLAGPNALLSRVKAPTPRTDFPGYWPDPDNSERGSE